MDAVWQFLHKPDVWIGLGIGIAGSWAAGYLPKFLKNVLLWGPKRFGRGLLGLLTDAYNVTKARQEPVAAAVYVAYHLTLLTVNVATILALLGLIAVLQILDPIWRVPSHRWVSGFALLVIVIVCYGVLKRLLFVALAYTAVFNPPKEATKLKIGKFEMELPPKPVQGKLIPPKPAASAGESPKDSNGAPP